MFWLVHFCLHSRRFYQWWQQSSTPKASEGVGYTQWPRSSLRSVFSDARRSPHFEQVNGTIMLVTEPLSIKNLGFLLQVENGHVILALL
jgi:hypothetical protein